MSALATARAVLAPLLLAALLVAAGDGATLRLRLRAERRFVAAAIAGLLLLHALLSAYDLLAVRWSVGTVVAPLLALAVAGAWLRSHSRASGTSLAADGTHGAVGPASFAPTVVPPLASAPARGGRLTGGDLVAGLAVVVFAALAWTRWIGNPDFVYHWGLKGHRFALAGHVDYAYLARPWSWVLHPDYPNLLPELFAATALLAGVWHEPSLLGWSPLLLVPLLVALRGTLRGAVLPALQREAVLAAIALVCAAFGIGYEMAGAADWLPALALAAALPPLLLPVGLGDAELGLCAALAAASKIEGITLGALLVLVQLARHARARRLPRRASLLALVLPPLLVGAHWALVVERHHLFQPTNAAAPSARNLAIAAPALLRAVMQTAWHGFPFLLLLLPALFAVRRLRPFACVAALQLASFIATYVVTPLDAAVLAITSFPRLVLQVLPATLAALAIAVLVPRDPVANSAPTDAVPGAAR